LHIVIDQALIILKNISTNLFKKDLDTPLEETCRAMSHLVDTGKTFYWGTSEWSAAEIAASIEICERYL
jgi:aryl-alcohol dehydrogenase-like predicted oxidoreductase